MELRRIADEVKLLNPGAEDDPAYRLVHSAMRQAKTNLVRSKPRLADDLEDVAEEVAKPALWRVQDRLSEWWKGNREFRVWGCLFEADELLTLIQSDETLRARIPDLEGSIATQLSPTDPGVRAYQELITSYAKDPTKIDRQVVRTACHLVNRTRVAALGNLRNFRNLLVILSLVLSLGLAVAGLIQMVDRSRISLCTAGGVGSSSQKVVCPSGTASRPGDVFEIELLGAFGGLLAAVLSLSRQRGYHGPYGLPLAQALLKAPTGAATALLGVLLLQKGLLEGILGTQSVGKVIAYAALFGYAQQVVTGAVDRQAAELLGRARSKADPARSAGPPMNPPAVATRGG